MHTYLYDSTGAWVAFISDDDPQYLFRADGRWIGWFPWYDGRAVTRDGRYLGTIVGDRLLSEVDGDYLSRPDYPGAPRFPRLPGRAPRSSHMEVPYGWRDVPLRMLALTTPGRHADRSLTA